MKIYTKTGDEGKTGLFGGGRVSKDSMRVEAYGEIDEVNAFVGLARTKRFDDDVDALLHRVQCTLFDIGAELASSPSRTDRGNVPLVADADVAELEQAIDRAEQELPPLETFVLPGGSDAGAQLHVARVVTRRAERSLVALANDEPVRGEVLRYVNRLGDLLFVLARLANARAGVEDVPWTGRDRAKGGGTDGDG